MEQKHTPGPWRWVDCGGYHKLETLGGHEIADDGSACGEYGGWMASPDEPNARLIAAAPDLLNALSVLADAAEARGIPVDAARAALARATSTTQP